MKSISDDITLRDYMDMRFAAITDALTLANATLSTRLDAMNEWRQQSRDQTATYLTRLEHDMFVRKIEESISDLRTSRDKLDGKASQSSVWVAYLFSILSLVTGLLSWLVKR